MCSRVSSFIWIYGEPCNCLRFLSLTHSHTSISFCFMALQLFLRWMWFWKRQPSTGWLSCLVCWHSLTPACNWIAWQIVDSRLMIYWNWLRIASLAKWKYKSFIWINCFFFSLVLILCFYCLFFISSSVASDYFHKSCAILWVRVTTTEAKMLTTISIFNAVYAKFIYLYCFFFGRCCGRSRFFNLLFILFVRRLVVSVRDVVKCWWLCCTSFHHDIHSEHLNFRVNLRRVKRVSETYLRFWYLETKNNNLLLQLDRTLIIEISGEQVNFGIGLYKLNINNEILARSSLVCRLSLIYSLTPCDPEHLDTFAVRMISPTFAVDDRWMRYGLFVAFCSNQMSPIDFLSRF